MIQNKEIWKDIPNYEGLYQVSNLGRVKSLKRKGRRNERILKPHLSSNVYYQIHLRKDSKAKTRTVHQLVAEAFLNHNPNGHTMVVNHIDLNKLNNNIKNLEIVTHRENSNHKHLKSTSKYTGVHLIKSSGRWRSKISVNNKKVSLGVYTTEIEAHEAYQNALKKLTL